MNIKRVLSLLSKDQDELDETPSQLIADAEAFVYEILVYAVDSQWPGEFDVIPNLLAMHGFLYDQYHRHDVDERVSMWGLGDDDLLDDLDDSILDDLDDDDKEDRPLTGFLTLGDDDDEGDKDDLWDLRGTSAVEDVTIPLPDASDLSENVPPVELGASEPTDEVRPQELGQEAPL